MTANQINARNAAETVRHNKRIEELTDMANQETARHQQAQDTESVRHNTETERLTDMANNFTNMHNIRMDAENARHNVAYEQETARHNQAGEAENTRHNEEQERLTEFGLILTDTRAVEANKNAAKSAEGTLMRGVAASRAADLDAVKWTYQRWGLIEDNISKGLQIGETLSSPAKDFIGSYTGMKYVDAAATGLAKDPLKTLKTFSLTK